MVAGRSEYVKNYLEMTRSEILEVVRRGGDDKRKIDRIVSNHLRGLDLSEKAQGIIADTDINLMAESFGGLFLPRDVEDYILENYH